MSLFTALQIFSFVVLNDELLHLFDLLIPFVV